MSSEPYVVGDGDYLTAIAYRFATTETKVLADPKNAKLKENRPNPEILAPGDVVYVPRAPRKWLPVTVGGTNSFKATPPMVTLNVVLKDHAGQPLASVGVETEPTVSDSPLTTDGSGTLTLQVPVHVKVVRVKVPARGSAFSFRVGQMAPHTHDSGVLSRLRQMGCLGNEDDHAGARSWLAKLTPATRAVALAQGVSEFQRRNGKEVTGMADDGLRGEIRDAHGC